MVMQIKAVPMFAQGSVVIVLNIDGNSIPLSLEDSEEVLKRLTVAREEAQEMYSERFQDDEKRINRPKMFRM